MEAQPASQNGGRMGDPGAGSANLEENRLDGRASMLIDLLEERLGDPALPSGTAGLAARRRQPVMASAFAVVWARTKFSRRTLMAPPICWNVVRTSLLVAMLNVFRWEGVGVVGSLDIFDAHTVLDVGESSSTQGRFQLCFPCSTTDLTHETQWT